MSGKLDRGFESHPLRYAFEKLALLHQVYEVPHFREQDQSGAAMCNHGVGQGTPTNRASSTDR